MVLFLTQFSTKKKLHFYGLTNIIILSSSKSANKTEVAPYCGGWFISRSRKEKTGKLKVLSIITITTIKTTFYILRKNKARTYLMEQIAIMQVALYSSIITVCENSFSRLP